MVLSQDPGAQRGVQCVLYALDAEKSRSVISLCHLADTHSFMGFPEPPSGLCTVQHNERGDGGGRETWEIREGGGEVFGWNESKVNCLQGCILSSFLRLPTTTTV